MIVIFLSKKEITSVIFNIAFLLRIFEKLKKKFS